MSAEKGKGDGETVPRQIKRKEKQHISERKREKLSRKRGRRNSIRASKGEGETVSQSKER